MYDQPSHLVIRDRHLSAAMSCAAAGSAYVGSSLKVYTKALVLGCTFRCGSAGSAAGSNSFKIARVGTSATQSAMQTSVVTAPAAGDVFDISLTQGAIFTVHSLGEAAALSGTAASLDKICVLSDIVWRYRMLPDVVGDNANQG